MGSEQRLVTMAGVTRLREEDKPDAEVVAELPRGTEIEVVHIKRDPFLQVSAWHPELGRVSGWVHKNFVQFPVEQTERKERRQIADPPCSACGEHSWIHIPGGRMVSLSAWKQHNGN